MAMCAAVHAAAVVNRSLAAADRQECCQLPPLLRRDDCPLGGGVRAFGAHRRVHLSHGRVAGAPQGRDRREQPRLLPLARSLAPPTRPSSIHRPSSCCAGLQAVMQLSADRALPPHLPLAGSGAARLLRQTQGHQRGRVGPAGCCTGCAARAAVAAEAGLSGGAVGGGPPLRAGWCTLHCSAVAQPDNCQRMGCQVDRQPLSFVAVYRPARFLAGAPHVSAPAAWAVHPLPHSVFLSVFARLSSSGLLFNSATDSFLPPHDRTRCPRFVHLSHSRNCNLGSAAISCSALGQRGSGAHQQNLGRGSCLVLQL